MCKLGLLGNNRVFKVFWAFEKSEKNQGYFSKCLLYGLEVVKDKYLKPLLIKIQVHIVKKMRENEFELSSVPLIKDVRSLRVNIDRALIFGYDLHEHFMQLILKFGQYLQHSLFIT